MIRTLYSFAWYVATPFVVLHLLWRSRKQPEYRRHWGQRWGLCLARPDSNTQLIWIHAVSVGETRAAQTLITEFEKAYPKLRILVTSMTPTGRQTSELLYGNRVLRSYLPYDYSGAMNRFVDHWQPTIAIIIETELWPNLMAACSRRAIPVCLVNGRLSERSLRKGLRLRWLITPALQQFSAIAAQSQADAKRLQELGAEHLTITGNMKFDISPPQKQLELGRSWRGRLGGRTVLAASTREGEERLLLAQWHLANAAKGIDTTLLVIVPRHPQRFDEVADLIAEAGFKVLRRSQVLAAQDDGASSQQPGDQRFSFDGSQVLLGDSMGEMFAYYAMADVAILGGSLLEHGGQNLIEPCSVGTPVIMGPHTFNFEEAAEQASALGAAIRVGNAKQAVLSALALINDSERRSQMSANGTAFTGDHSGATRKTLDILEPWLVK
jgi:3-deoxy-D-manno-octulosonic-acid transferase